VKIIWVDAQQLSSLGVVAVGLLKSLGDDLSFCFLDRFVISRLGQTVCCLAFKKNFFACSAVRKLSKRLTAKSAENAKIPQRVELSSPPSQSPTFTRNSQSV